VVCDIKIPNRQLIGSSETSISLWDFKVCHEVSRNCSNVSMEWFVAHDDMGHFICQMILWLCHVLSVAE